MWLFSIMIYTDWPCALSSPRLDKCAIINPHYYYHYFSIKPECIVTTNPDRSVLVTIITWHSQLHLVNVSILLVRYEYGVRSESRNACYSHRYVTRCPLTTDDALVIFYLMPLISAFKSVNRYSTTMEYIDTFTRTSARVSKMNAVARAQLTFQILTLLQKHLYRQSQRSKHGAANVWPW